MKLVIERKNKLVIQWEQKSFGGKIEAEET